MSPSVSTRTNERAAAPLYERSEEDEHAILARVGSDDRARLAFLVHLALSLQIDLVGDYDDREIVLVLDLSDRVLTSAPLNRADDHRTDRHSPARSVGGKR